jgi:hypothetical protein
MFPPPPPSGHVQLISHVKDLDGMIVAGQSNRNLEHYLCWYCAARTLWTLTAIGNRSLHPCTRCKQLGMASQKYSVNLEVLTDH